MPFSLGDTDLEDGMLQKLCKTGAEISERYQRSCNDLKGNLEKSKT